MKTCSSDMSTRVKQRAVVKFLTVENVTPTKIHHRVKAVYGYDTVNRSSVNRFVLKFHVCESGKAILVNEIRSRSPITAIDEKHRQLADNFIQSTAKSLKSLI